jgi:hypothetical protein
MELRLEVVQVPVSDVDRAKAFYTDNLGFVLDHDVEHIPGMRVVQLTPPGSSASIVIGTGMNSMTPGSLEGLQLVVPEMGAARSELLRRGAPSAKPTTWEGSPSPISAIRTATGGSSRKSRQRKRKRRSRPDRALSTDRRFQPLLADLSCRLLTSGQVLTRAKLSRSGLCPKVLA